MAEENAVAEVKKNCAGCNKPFKKVRRYYRNGKYYCNKNCWKTKAKAAQAASQEPAKEAAK